MNLSPNRDILDEFEITLKGDENDRALDLQREGVISGLDLKADPE